jgi:hypothetical protein|nr:MAG TPA: hypothetical protein [Caudoviricetes sp.]
MKKTMIGYIAGMMLLCCAVINIRCELNKAKQARLQAGFQKALVEKSKGHEKAELNDSIVWEVNR